MPKPTVASYCTTFLKPEMLHIYRQVTSLQRYQTFVVTKERICEDRFPFAPVELMPGNPRKNFLRRFWLKHVRKLSPLYYRGELQGLMKIFRQRHADLMHIYFGHTGVHLLPFIKGWEKPCLVSFHGMDVQTRTGQPDYEGKLRELLQVTPLVLARSFSLRDRLLALGCPPEKIRINRTGIPLEFFPFCDRAAPAGGAWRFVQACRLIPKKGLRTALTAFSQFVAQFPQAHFTIAGEGPMQREITDLVRALKLEQAVTLRGFLAQKELRELYAESHIFIHPSELTADQNQEGIPNSMLEAMSTGLPVLATWHGGIPEAVEDGVTGWLVPERDHTALFKKMLELTETLETWRAFGRAASESVCANFEQRKQIEKLESFYDEAVQGGKLAALEAAKNANGGAPQPTPGSTAVSFAYLFERFPSFTQTFAFREVEEMFRQKMSPAIYSLRPAEEQSAFARELLPHVTHLPENDALRSAVRAAQTRKEIPPQIWEAIKNWGTRHDKTRLYEAAWLGLELRRRGIRHVHAHFAGMAARTAYWLKKLWGITYSFTGHANDIFVENHFPVSLENLVAEARLVVTETDYSRDWLCGKFPHHSQKMVRVYNGIHVQKFLPSASLDEGIPKIVSIGRLVEKKGFATLIAACALLKQRGTLFYCRIIGAGPLEAVLRAQIAEHALDQYVALEGAKPEEEIMRFLHGARVFALACTREGEGGMDNLPTVIMEAMACAVPVVSTRLAGIPEMVIPGETGELVKENDPEALAAALDTLLKTREYARRIGERGRAVAAKRFSTDVTTRRLKHLLVRHGRIRPPLPAIRIDPSLLWSWLHFG